MAYILGIDGGNSKTLAVVANRAGQVAGMGRSGCGNHQAHGLTPAMDQVRLAIHRALRSAGVATDEVEAAYYCMAGAGLPEDFDLLRPALESIGAGKRIDLNNDIL